MDYAPVYYENKAHLIKRMKFYGASNKLIEELEQKLESMKFAPAYVAVILSQISTIDRGRLDEENDK